MFVVNLISAEKFKKTFTTKSKKMKHSNRLILSKITIATLNRQKMQYTPGGKMGVQAYMDMMNIDTNIPTSYTTPICTTVPGVLIQ
jgi:hypothetical protein